MRVLKVFALAAFMAVPAMADWVTATVPAGNEPLAAAVNPVTNKVYLANGSSSNVTVIDGATNGTALVSTGADPYAVAVNPVTDKIYVADYVSNNVTVIDGATNDTVSVRTGTAPCAVAVNPVTNKVYVVNYGSIGVTVITDAPANDTKVRAEMSPLSGDTTNLARPSLVGKGVNRSTPHGNVTMGMLNRLNTAQRAWNWAAITSGAGTDSVQWSYT